MDTLEEIRRKSILDIKDKVKKYPKYLHPCNKERLKDMKRLMFSTGNEFTQWMQQNGIMRNVTDINHEYMEKVLKNAKCKTQMEYKNKVAKKSGFKNCAEIVKIKSWNNGIHEPLEFNGRCSSWFGEFTENIMIKIYPGAKKMPYGNIGFDYLWKDIKINCKGRCLRYDLGHSPCWKFSIRWNNLADKFLLSGWDSRENLIPIIALEFDRNDIIRGTPFWKRESFAITYSSEGLQQFEDHIIDIGWLKAQKEEEMIQNAFNWNN